MELAPDVKKLSVQYQHWHESIQAKGEATIAVDEVAAKVASFYEKIRGVVDWREEHLLRKTAIERILKRTWPTKEASKNKMEIFSCHLDLVAEQVSISFPFYPEGCPHGCATCKPTLFQSLRDGATKTVVIGDGVSDFLIAREADMVFAKGTLREFCRREGIAFQNFDNLHDVVQSIDCWA